MSASAKVTQLDMFTVTREWTEIPPYHASQYDRKHGHLTYSWYCMIDNEERIVCVHKPENGAPWAGEIRYIIERYNHFEGWISLSPFNVLIHSEEQAFAVAEWRQKRRIAGIAMPSFTTSYRRGDTDGESTKHQAGILS